MVLIVFLIGGPSYEAEGNGKKDGKYLLFPFPLYQGKHPLPYQLIYLTGQFSNCMQKPVMSACLSWDLGFKKPRPILLSVITMAVI